MDGWIRSHRKMFDNPVVCKDAEHYAVWGYLLHYAAHEPYDVVFNGERITLKPGQLITSKASIARKFSISESKVQRILKTFENELQIELQATRHGRLVSVKNWAKYQKYEPQIEPQVNHNWPTGEPQVVRNNNIKNVNNIINTCENPENDKVDYQKVIDMYHNSCPSFPKVSKVTDARKKVIRARLKDYSEEELEKAFKMAEESDFLTGRNGKWGGANFDWIMNTNNIVKILEGNYKNKTENKPNGFNSGELLQSTSYNWDEINAELGIK